MIAEALERDVETPALRLRVLSFGALAAPPLVVLPGITSPAATWAFAGRALADCFSVHVPDLRGRGRSDAPSSGYAIDDYVDDLDAVVREIGLTRPLLVGHSLGARIVAAYAVRRPGVARGLVLADPPLSGPARPYPTTLEQFLDALRSARAGTATVADVRRAFPRWDDEHLATRLEWLPTCSEAAIAETHAGFHADDFRVWWRALARPLLLVRGAESEVVTPADLNELREANHAAELATLPNAGHMVAHDAPEAFLGLVRDFDEQISSNLSSYS